MNESEYREELRRDMESSIRLKQMHARPGFVYFARVPSDGNERRVKIGLSSNPVKRVQAQGLVMERCVEVPDMARAETLVHMWLRRYSVAFGREVFSMTKEHVIRAAHTVNLLTEEMALDGDE